MHEINVCAQIAFLLELFRTLLALKVHHVLVAKEMVLQRAGLIEPKAAMVTLVPFLRLR